MNIITYTTLYAIGSINEIKSFKKSLPIEDNFFDFKKIIPIPFELEGIYVKSSKEELRKLNDWRRDNWGTPGEGFVEKISEIYSRNEMALEIELSTPYGEPVYIIDKITTENSNLHFFVHHISCFGDEHIGFKSKEDKKINLICETVYDDHYEEQSYSIHQESLIGLQKSNIGYFQWEFLHNKNIGNHIIENLQNI